MEEIGIERVEEETEIVTGIDVATERAEALVIVPLVTVEQEPKYEQKFKLFKGVIFSHGRESERVRNSSGNSIIQNNGFE